MMLEIYADVMKSVEGVTVFSSGLDPSILSVEVSFTTNFHTS